MNYNYEEINKHIQWLCEFMKKEYPNGYELIITPSGAEVRSNLCVMSFLSDDLKMREPTQEEMDAFFKNFKNMKATIFKKDE